MRKTVLYTPMARAILRRSGYRYGATTRGIPSGGLKGDAVVKKSDADYDVWWAPNGPYTYNWNELDQARMPPATTSSYSDDGSALLSVEPVPLAVNSFAHINQPLRSGVDNQDDYGFKWNPWAFDHSSSSGGLVITGTWRVESPEFSNTGFKEGAMRGDKSLHPIPAGLQYRLQAYITRCSSECTISVRSSLDTPDTGDTYNITAPGYFDSGWVDRDMTPGAIGNNNNYASMRVEFFDGGMRDPAIPFFDIQMRTFETTNFFDWMYKR